MKAIIPVAGMGTRLRPHTHTVPKALIPVAGKPMISHILDKIEALDISELILVVGYLGKKIVEYVKDNYDFDVDYVEQERRLGLGHAIYLTREYIHEDEPILIVLGDTLFEADLKTIINPEFSTIGVKKVSDPEKFGIISLDQDKFITEVQEKPEDYFGNLAVVGVYYFLKPENLYSSLQYIIGNDIRTKGEYQLTDAVDHMLKEEKEKIATFEVNEWYDCGKPETLLDTNKRLLKKNFKNKEYHLEGSIVIPPVSIAENSVVEHSIIGPYVTIAYNTTIKRSIIKDSIISQNAIVENMTLDKSIIGDMAKVKGSSNKLNVGDSSEIDFE